MLAEARKHITYLGLTAATNTVAAPGSGATITLAQFSDAARFKWVCLALWSSHDSGTNGISVEVSYDGGTTWRVMGTSSYTATNGWWKFKKHLTEGIMRLRYVNSANLLTAFEGSVYLSNEDYED